MTSDPEKPFDLSGLKFTYAILDEEWNEDHTVRTIRKIKLDTLGPVTRAV